MLLLGLAATFLTMARFEGSDDQLARVLGNAVRAERTRRDWSVPELAERCGLETVELAEVEAGRSRPDLGLIRDIAGGLEMRPSELLHTAEELMG